jgi:hypothetical protein
MLHKTVDEVEDLTVGEFIEWQAWWRIRHGKSDS